jgi:GNAT superfamily N-acetyltransferase
LKDDEVVGCVAGSVTDCLFNPQIKEFVEIVWYVEESHRRAGLRLFNRLEQACKDKGVKAMRMAYMVNSKADKLAVFYEKKGYRPMELHLFKKMEE